MRILEIAVAAFFGVLSLPPFVFGAYLLGSRARTLFSDVYYADYPYLLVGAAYLFAGVASCWATYYTVRKRRFFGLLLLIPFLAGFATLITLPNIRPNLNSMMADSNFLSSVNSFMRVWYDKHHRFPTDEKEFQQAMKEGPAAWQYRISVPESAYRQRGSPVPYELVVVHSATGPKISSISTRPGVVYYCISSDLQSFWVTMTGLNRDIASSAEISRVANHLQPRIIHAQGSDFKKSK